MNAAEGKKKALVCRGGWEGHEPEQCAAIFNGVLKDRGYETVVSNTLDSYMDGDLMGSMDLVVPVWTMSEISDDQWAGLKKAVLEGCGVAGWHGGMGDSFRDNVQYQFMVGGQWVAHPGGIIPHTINITSDDPIVAGIGDFSLESEQYYMHVDPSNEVLATTTFAGDQDDIDWIAGTTIPVAWKRTYGRGRIFYASFGHVAKDFETPETVEIIARGMAWATR